jgi:hypothetical protein
VGGVGRGRWERGGEGQRRCCEALSVRSRATARAHPPRGATRCLETHLLRRPLRRATRKSLLRFPRADSV